MARKSKKKVARKKVVSQPRKAGSRPVLALLLFFTSVCSFVAIWDFEIAQSRQHTTEPEMNLVGVFGAELSFWAFYIIGVATWLIPLYLLWGGYVLLFSNHVAVAC
jgi:S-DNA-T family DNA segregation ATPase FtsK/SpoIIIE